MSASKSNKVCCFCSGDAGKYGNNPEPLMNGSNNSCCDKCNAEKVIPARFRFVNQYNKTAKQKIKYVPPQNELVVKPSSEIAVATDKTGKVMTFPLQTGEGEVLDENEKAEINGEVVLSGHDAFHPDVLIRTTKKEIEEVMEAMDTMDKSKAYFRHSWERIKNVNTDALYLEGGAKWKDFLDDIVVYYCARFRVFGKPMPAVHTPEVKEMIEKIGNGDAQADFSTKQVVSKK